MAYTIGPSHGPFSGAGSFAIAKPAGIRTVTSSIPGYTGHDGGSPQRYFRLAHFTLGNTDGFSHSERVEYATQLLYPIPPVWELLAYDISTGASCVFQELVDVPDLTLKQPWDRTPLPLGQFAQADRGDANGAATMWTYTVPAGRKLYVASARVAISRTVASSVAATAECWVLSSVGYLCLTTLHGRNINDRAQDELNGGPLILNPGQVVSGSYYAGTGNGTCNYHAHIQGTLFDA